nr:S53 family peptidase [Streptomyces sp. NBC_00886]
MALIVSLVLGLTGTAAAAPARPSGPTAQPSAGPGAVTSRRVCNPSPGPGRASCLAMLRTDLPPLRTVQPESQPSGYHPSDIQTAYSLPRGGAGRTVAIIDPFNTRTAESDLAVYRRQFNLPPCTTANGCFRKINQYGGTTPPRGTDPGWALETSLDLDAVSAACPDCKILLVQSTDAYFSNMFAAVRQAVAQGVKYVSMSWGAPEYSGETAGDSVFTPGVAFVAASGDAGYPHLIYPAASRYVTAAGGTTLRQVQTPPGFTETAWSGGGSGCSLYESKPPFQHDTGCPRRTAVDISADADPATGLAVYDTTPTDNGGTGWMVVGGTSLSSPLIAAMYAVAGTPGPADRPNSYPYAHPQAFRDITRGSNGSCGGSYLCTAKTGYDGPTGIGAPLGIAGL